MAPSPESAVLDAPVRESESTTGTEMTSGTELVLDDLLVEEISIDGMCGVY